MYMVLIINVLQLSIVINLKFKGHVTPLAFIKAIYSSLNMLKIKEQEENRPKDLVYQENIGKQVWIQRKYNLKAMRYYLQQIKMKMY